MTIVLHHVDLKGHPRQESGQDDAMALSDLLDLFKHCLSSDYVRSSATSHASNPPCLASWLLLGFFLASFFLVSCFPLFLKNSFIPKIALIDGC